MVEPADTAQTASLVELHGQLLQQLAQLDAAGAHAAAAHLVAAIDALEDRLKIARPERRLRDKSRLDQLAAALIDRFGGRAVEVSRKQLSNAEGDALLAWAAIIARLGIVNAAARRR